MRALSPAFWQCLLAAELRPDRARQIAEQVAGSSLEPLSALRNWLQPSERERAQGADLQALERAIESGVSIVEAGALPDRIRRHPDCPPALFVWGDAGVMQGPVVAIVGTRAATTYGKAVASKFAEHLARAGVVIASGGALGIDAAAHTGALAAGGKTLAVLAGGVDTVYPQQHRGLFQRIREAGCLISQFAVGTKPRGFRFLERNRLLARIADATLLVEVPERSGAQTTASEALERGSGLAFVVPAGIDNVNFRGSHALIRDGANLVDHPDQILAEFGLRCSKPTASRREERSAIAGRILAVMGVEPLAGEAIAEHSGLDPADVLAELTLLELSGHVIRDGVGYAVRP